MNSKPVLKSNLKSTPKPLLFISHRHIDKNIADVISKFVKSKSGGRVEIFQSSSCSTKGPQIGKNLNQQLMQYLWKASAVVLVYTTPDQDWSYCMWECGVAMDPESPDTRVILFQCAGRTPAVFADQVRVDIRNLVDIQRFSNEFLTNPAFFPGYGRAIAPGFQENSPEVLDAAQELYDKLQKEAPPLADEPAIEDWPAFPFLQLEISFDHVDSICNATPKKRSQVARNIVKQQCLISGGDKAAEQLFGVPSLSSGMPFQKLIEKWKKKNPRSRSKWVEALSCQIMDGAQWDFPQLVWELMPGIDRNTWYAPMLTRVRKIPSRRCIQFDIYFYKFFLDTEKNCVNIGIPSA